MLLATMLVAMVFMVVALVRGRKFSRLAGLIGVTLAMLSIYSNIWLAASEQLVLNSILLVPVIALMLGWFLVEGYARAGMLVSSGILIVLVALRGQELDWPSLSVTTIIYIALLTGFLFEIGVFVHRRMKQQASIDPLTGALNRFGFWRDASIELKRSVRRGYPVTVVSIDFDDFKRLNDTRGHHAGDAVLFRVVAQWRTTIRSGGIIVRLGGDEFALLLAEVSEATAARIIDELRGRAEHPWSWGIAQWIPGESLDSLLERADAELLRSRRRL